MTNDEVRKILASRPRTLAVDLDGTLAEFDEWRGFEHIGKPIWPVIRAVQREYSSGSRIIIHSARLTSLNNEIVPESVTAVQSWLKEHEVPYHDIWLKPGKPSADAYIDDKALLIPAFLEMWNES